MVAVVMCVSVGVSYFVLSTLSERDGYSGGYEYSMSGTYDSEGVSGLDAYGTAVLEFKEESDLYRVYRIDFFLSYGNSDGSVSGDMEPFGTDIFFGGVVCRSVSTMSEGMMFQTVKRGPFPPTYMCHPTGPINTRSTSARSAAYGRSPCRPPTRHIRRPGRDSPYRVPDRMSGPPSSDLLPVCHSFYIIIESDSLRKLRTRSAYRGEN